MKQLVKAVLFCAGIGAPVLTASALLASAPESAPRPPLTRVGSAAPIQPALRDANVALSPQLRPRLRPMSTQQAALIVLPHFAPHASPQAPVVAPRPDVRSENFVQKVLFGRAKKRRGAVCGDIEIQGDVVGTLTASNPGCGAKNAVRVRSVAGVALSQPSLMTCDTAKTLRKWVEDDVETAFGRSNRVVKLRVAAHYACRTRNNRPGARISEHGKARAIDISGFVLSDGSTVTVLKGWQQKSTRKRLKKIWKAACGPFGTVLGPESDVYHRDHFHLDTARYRSGSYCR